MNRMLLCALVMLSLRAYAQNAPQSDSTNTNVVVAKLSVPTYPPLARQARIEGTVNLDVIVRANGGVESVVVVSGHPTLIKAALESAQKTLFDCKDCNNAPAHYPMTYKFALGETIYCTQMDNGDSVQYETYRPQVTQSQGTITIVDRPVATCDPSTSISVVKVRSARCLFLWRCGRRYPL